GQLKRADLARTLIENPDLLLLDEPTNHLDFAAIRWLENYLNSYRGTIVCISHDRTFLRNISDKVFWLDRGRIRVCPKGYAHFDDWSQALLEQEERELMNRQKIIELEEEWASRGVKARRKRNMRRLENVKADRERLKADKSLFRQTMQKMELAPLTTELSSKLVAEFIKVNKKFKEDGRKEKVILDNFNLRVLRGDKIGILGNNGSGKTSFLKLLIKELEPDAGKIKLAKNIEISYFDQKRSNLDPQKSLWKTLCPNGDHIEVMGKNRHVCGYLKDFLFDPKAANDLVGTLSGGQKNRLMLAKTLANPGNCLILDEPTNDLDMDTLDILEEILANYKGTLFVVSHDRDFLDQTVNKVLAFEGDGVVEPYIGGYSDYLEQSKGGNLAIDNQGEAKGTTKASDKEPTPKGQKKLTYKLQYELDNLPRRIEALEKELVNLNAKFSNPDFHNQPSEEKDKILKLSKETNEELAKLEERWLELAEMKENL
ncbi:MAG: ATP-binding cassette domain-containing protein, partial [Proteobacteria bacterium]|nr:ATP-binding cassette domain-containing protein [Pseudomonadota bacterium]